MEVAESDARDLTPNLSDPNAKLFPKIVVELAGNRQQNWAAESIYPTCPDLRSRSSIPSSTAFLTTFPFSNNICIYSFVCIFVSAFAKLSCTFGFLGGISLKTDKVQHV